MRGRPALRVGKNSPDGYLVEHVRLDDTRVKTLALGKTGRPGDTAKVEIVAYADAS